MQDLKNPILKMNQIYTHTKKKSSEFLWSVSFNCMKIHEVAWKYIRLHVVVFWLYDEASEYFGHTYKGFEVWLLYIDIFMCVRIWTLLLYVHNLLITQVDHSIVKLNTMCDQKKSSFGKLHHQNGSKFYQIFFMSRYTQYLWHSQKW